MPFWKRTLNALSSARGVRPTLDEGQLDEEALHHHLRERAQVDEAFRRIHRALEAFAAHSNQLSFGLTLRADLDSRAVPAGSSASILQSALSVTNGPQWSAVFRESDTEPGRLVLATVPPLPEQASLGVASHLVAITEDLAFLWATEWLVAVLAAADAATPSLAPRTGD